MTLAFYAPLKPPSHPTPSGDRAMARAVIAALEYLGAKVTVASTLRSRDGAGDLARQTALQANARAEIPALVAQGHAEGWQAWITYHNYYKAPDLLGPTISAALGIPYIQIESTRARKRLTGPWATFAKAAETASDAADMIFHLTERDAKALHRDARTGQHIRLLRPFLNHKVLPPAAAADGPMLVVGMMRAGDKFASYQLIAETLTLLPSRDWHLNIAGDGPARAEVEALFTLFQGNVTFLGALDSAALTQAYETASCLLWPGVNEAFGLVYLEAQYHGLPVIAQDRPGVRDVLAPGQYPVPEQGAQGLAEMLQAPRQTSATDTQTYVQDHHLLPAAAETLRQGLADLGVMR